ncbi:hypothetical protein D3261_19420 [Halococcus sp. IIIV-5B]|nr:hypothetical protein D3261_19420 [Halococcus sp. IIIV-5B]
MLDGGFGGVTPCFGPGRTLLQIRELVFEVEDIVKEVAVLLLSFGGAFFELLLRLAKLVILARESMTILAMLLLGLVELGTNVIEL